MMVTVSNQPPLQPQERPQRRSLSLAQQFLGMSFIVILLGMLAIGSWLERKIEQAVTTNSAAAAAIYMDSFIAPLLQELAQQPELSKQTQLRLNQLFTKTPLGERVYQLKVWQQNSQLAFSTTAEQIGKSFPPTSSLKQAWQGVVSAEFDDLEAAENEPERGSGQAFLEIYSPVHESQTGRIIAVAEFYERTDLLASSLLQAKLQSWLVVGLVTLLMLAVLYVIVRKGSHTIEQQRLSLETRIQQLSILRQRLEQSSRMAIELNERFLRRIGSDLHDGPAQLLSVALLRLDGLKLANTANNEQQNFETIRRALNDALRDIRYLCHGLILPELDNLSLRQALLKAINTHQQISPTKIEYIFDAHLPKQLDKPIKTSLYRLVQEGLNNAYRHAPNSRRLVRVECSSQGSLLVSVQDSGPGFDLAQISHSQLGLAGLRERIESIGGTFTIHSSVEHGTLLMACFQLAKY